MDSALRRAVHPDPYKRYESLSEFTFDLRHPNAKYLNASAPPLIERNPLLFWKCATVILGCIVVALLAEPAFRPLLVGRTQAIQASSVAAIIGFGATPWPGFIRNS